MYPPKHVVGTGEPTLQLPSWVMNISLGLFLIPGLATLWRNSLAGWSQARLVGERTCSGLVMSHRC